MVQPTKAAAAAKSASLIGLPAGTLDCMTPTQTQAVANFGAAHNVTPSATGNGSISPNTAQSVNDGSTATFTLTPNPGSHIVNVTGTCGGSLSGNTYTTNAITADCTVIANFAGVAAAVVATPGPNRPVLALLAVLLAAVGVFGLRRLFSSK